MDDRSGARTPRLELWMSEYICSGGIATIWDWETVIRPGGDIVFVINVPDYDRQADSLKEAITTARKTIAHAFDVPESEVRHLSVTQNMRSTHA